MKEAADLAIACKHFNWCGVCKDGSTKEVQYNVLAKVWSRPMKVGSVATAIIHVILLLEKSVMLNQ